MRRLLSSHAILLSALVAMTGSAGLRAFAGTLHKDAMPFLVTTRTTDNRDGTTTIVMREAAPLANAPATFFYRVAVSIIT